MTYTVYRKMITDDAPTAVETGIPQVAALRKLHTMAKDFDKIRWRSDKWCFHVMQQKEAVERVWVQPDR